MKEDSVAEVALVDVSKSYGTVEAVRGLSLSIADGEFLVLLGPTGAGKTTTLRLIAGLERPDRGNVLIQGRVVTDQVPAERDVAFVFQQYSLYPHLTVYDNLAFPLRSPARRPNEKPRGRPGQEGGEPLHIERKLGTRAPALSGGEMQRVAIGRALVREPAVYLMDEPLSSLDAKLRAELRLELKRIQRELGTTILYVTHDQVEAMTMADRIGVMNEGVLVQLGTPREIYERPKTAYVAGRLGTPIINLIPAELLGNTLPPRVQTVGLRTEHIRISSGDGPGPRAQVHWVEHLGDQNHVHLKLATHSLVTLADPSQPLRAGDQVSLEFESPLYFDQAGNRLGTDGLRGHA